MREEEAKAEAKKEMDKDSIQQFDEMQVDVEVIIIMY